MNITAITKFKHGDLWHLLRKVGWSQSELARRCNVSPSCIGCIICMKNRPSQETAERLQQAFASVGEYLDILEAWPESFRGFKKIPSIEVTKDIPIERLLGVQDTHPALDLHRLEIREAIDAALETITPREKAVIESRFFEQKTLDEVGCQTNRGRERIRQIEAKALRKLGHPFRKLNNFTAADEWTWNKI